MLVNDMVKLAAKVSESFAFVEVLASKFKILQDACGLLPSSLRTRTVFLQCFSDQKPSSSVRSSHFDVASVKRGYD